MSTTVENAQPEQPITSSTPDETMKVEEEAPEIKVEDAGVMASSQESEKKTYTPKKNGYRTYENGVLKTTRQEDHTNKRNNSKYDPSILPETDDAAEIRKQVEFYFSDSNLPSDNFLWDATKGTSNMPVKVEIICKFGRMKRFKSMTVVVAALRESKFLEVSGPEGHEEVKRKYAYDPDVKRPASEARSIYAKGFGDEEPSSQFDIEAFFAPYGPINAVRLRRTDEKLFKGSVFVEFQDVETAEKFLALDPKPKWKGEHVLDVKAKKQYNDEKIEDIKEGKIKPGPTYTPKFQGRGRGRGDRGGYRGRNDRDRGGRRDRGDRDPDDWKKRREDDRANGFKDDRNRRDSKGGRGRGRGRHDRGPRDNDRNREAEDREKNGDDSEKKSESKSEATAEEPQVDSKKRAREDDGEAGAEAKKVDSKPEAVAESPKVENDKKRLRADDGEGGSTTKKVDSESS
ncbi:autoantigen [Hyphodiscus hymeniophilus]|uniref:Autoantigen n=1 Tax=Hyphodiscus hymeniophilus TaxID=353542 RepID=A0A9P6VJZ1_9HELO|nr:autoantigen [Hyphodiscus hymeniophilus]